MSEEVAHQSEHEPVVHDEHGQDQEGYIQIVGFALGSEEFGVDISVVKEIIRMPIMTRVPNTPDFVVGVVNMRGKVIPVVDLCIRFGLPQSKVEQSERKIMVIEHDDKTVGLLVDKVNQVINVNHSIMSPPPSMVAGIESDYITAIAKMEDALLILLEISKILVFVSEEKA